MPETIHQLYQDYWRKPDFRDDYLTKRLPLYRRMVGIATRLRVRRVLDVGCACGQFVDLCFAARMDAWGLDLPIEELRAIHGQLSCGPGRFLYGAIEDSPIQGKLAALGPWDLVTCIATLRHLHDIASLLHLNSRYYLIGETSDNSRVRRARRGENDLRLWSPGDLSRQFTGYRVQRIYLPRFLLRIDRPPRWMLGLVNSLSNSYGILLRRVEANRP